jgi:hypothetical protein
MQPYVSSTVRAGFANRLVSIFSALVPMVAVTAKSVRQTIALALLVPTAKNAAEEIVFSVVLKECLAGPPAV